MTPREASVGSVFVPVYQRLRASASARKLEDIIQDVCTLPHLHLPSAYNIIPFVRLCKHSLHSLPDKSKRYVQPNHPTLRCISSQSFTALVVAIAPAILVVPTESNHGLPSGAYGSPPSVVRGHMGPPPTSIA